MAIDTATKRASALTYAMAPVLLPIPNSTITQDDRQTLLGFYGGILATAAVAIIDGIVQAIVQKIVQPIVNQVTTGC